MLFGSLTFLFVFLPILIFLYYIADRRYRNAILLLSSILFYAWGGVSYALILLASLGFNFTMVKLIEKNNALKRFYLFVGLTLNILLIAVFKYLDFLIENLNLIKSLFSDSPDNTSLMGIALPLGISFFTFQQMSMLWDVYRDPNHPKATIINTSLYISLFPQLIAGPIVRYKDIIEQINQRKESIKKINSGVQRFIIGLFKKIMIANTFGLVADTIIESDLNTIDTPTAWLGIIAYTFQIFFDFSGYSDMAIGLGKIFGFDILENFNLPYTATSIRDFWRKWHISLSTWFRDYVYIPLGGSRTGKFKTYRNLFIVFFLTGLWHGATWTFILWGLFHGIFLILENIGLQKALNKIPKLFQWMYAMLVVIIGWVLFRIENLSEAIHYIKKLFGVGINTINHGVLSHINLEILWMASFAIFLSLGLHRRLLNLLTKVLPKEHAIFLLVKNTLLIFMFLITITYINSGSYNPFIYFRF